MLWIVRLVASSGLLGVLAAWPASAASAVVLALGLCAVGAGLALAARLPAVQTLLAARRLPRTLPLPR